MQFNRFDLNLLIALDALVHEKNVTRAAERVHLSQPAMSAALLKLRDYFGDQLLVRVGRDMELTPRGLSLVEPVREALLRIQTTLGTQPVFDPATTKRTFTVVFSESTVPGLLPAVLQQIHLAAPGIECRIEPVTQSALTRLEHGEVDLCVCLDVPRLYEARAYPDSLRSAPLRSVRWVCALANEHPLANQPLTLQQYQGLIHIFGRPGGYSASPAELVRRLLGFEINVHMALPSMMQLPLMLPGTEFAATLPERVAALFAHLPITIKSLPFEPEPMREIMLWHKRSEPDPVHAWLRELIIRLAI
jgi:DNA-binding transcriptional LysR family regulator